MTMEAQDEEQSLKKLYESVIALEIESQSEIACPSNLTGL